MADVKISALPAAGTLTSADVLPLVQGASTTKVSLTQLDTRWVSPSQAANDFVNVTGDTMTGSLGVPNLGVGTNLPVPDRLVNIGGSPAGTATTQWGILSAPVFKSSTTVRGYAGFFRCDTAAATFTLAEARGLIVSSPNVGAGSAIGVSYGLEIGAQKIAGVTTGYGIYQSGAADLNVLAGPLALGTNPAATGIVRLPNNQAIVARNAANGGDVQALSVTTGDVVQVGGSAGVAVPGSVAIGASPPANGSVRLTSGSLFNTAAGGSYSFGIGGSALVTLSGASGLTISTTVILANGVDIGLGSVSGTKIGADPGQKLGFYGATPVARPTGTPAAATDPATTMALVNSLRASLIALGLIS